MRGTTICYISDENYLLPTLVSARQARNNAPPSSRVSIFCVGAASAATRTFESVCSRSEVLFNIVPPEAIEGMSMTFARLFLPRFVDSETDEILYMDGDTNITGALEPLISAPRPAGALMAARDPMTLLIQSEAPAAWPERRAYLRGIGIPEHRLTTYFNAGVMRFALSDWEAISREALARCRARSSPFRWVDQDAINLAVNEAHVPISMRWNTPSFFLHYRLAKVLRPKLLHFMSNPRPWNGPFAPWGRAGYRVYTDFVEEFPELRPFVPKINMKTKIRYHGQQLWKRVTEAGDWANPETEKRLAELERDTLV